MIPLSDYYIIAGVVYQAPDLGTVISSRVVNICHAIIEESSGITHCECNASIFCVFSFLLSMEFSLLSMRPCHIVVITHPKGTGGILRTRRREVRLWSLCLGITRTTGTNEVSNTDLNRKKQA